MSVTYRNISDLKPARWNPTRRTETDKVKPIVESMQEIGYDPAFPIVIDAKGTIGDGNRRYTAAKIVGIKKIPCIVTERDLQETWARASTTVCPPTPGQIDDAVVNKKFPISKLPARYQKSIGRFIDIAGRDTYEMIVRDYGLTHNMIKQVINIAAYVNRTDDKEFMRRTVNWLVKHKAQYHVRSAITHRFVTPARLLELIDNDQAPSM